MITEAVVSFVVEKIGDFLVHQGSALLEVHDQIEWVKALFQWMQAFLKDADTKQNDARVKKWVATVRDIAYKAEDVIDKFILQTEQNGRSEYLKHKLGKEIEEMKNELIEIGRRRKTYGIENLGKGREGSSSMRESLREQRRTSPLLGETEIIGFQEDIKTLVARLIKGESWRCVISIVGMGGLGKTTLARKVYNHDAVKKHFDGCAWIYVSQEYDVRDLLQSIMRCFMNFSTKHHKMDIIRLKEKLFEHLKVRRYFVVLDDIWKTDTWDALADAFPDMNNGSRVLLTTRNRGVASYADARSCLHELQLLGQDKSWDLFCKKTFLEQDSICPTNLESLGKEIVAKCHGLPLAVIVIGGLLSRKARLPSEWKKVLRGIGQQFVEGHANISRLLALSYEDLPYPLKLCFLYLGAFPEDYEIPARKLIRLWVAEGFAHSRGVETFEEVAEDCLQELIQRSLIQIVKRSSIGAIKSCRIHDFLRDLSISKAKEEKFLDWDTNSLSPCIARGLIVHCGIGRYTSLNQSTPCLRSILCFTLNTENLGKNQLEILCGRFHLLRVLHLHQIGVEEFPNEIGTLIHLRYIGVTGCANILKRLPSSIANLCNLQTLELESEVIIDIPSDIWKMQQLRHICVKGRITGERLKEGELSCSSNLQTLETIWADDWMEDCLGKLTNLRKLGILGLDLSRQGKGLFDTITKMDHLQSLTLRGQSLSPFPPNLNLLHPLKLRLAGKLYKPPESHEFSPNLTKLTLKDSNLEQDPMRTLEKLENLRFLKLKKRSYMGKEMVCSAQGFPRLESLKLAYMVNLEEWRVKEGAMPCLLHLHIHQCKQLKMLPEGLQHVISLRKLKLTSMPQTFTDRLQEDKGDDRHKIQHIPSIDIQNTIFIQD